MQPFLQFRTWLRRGPIAERVSAGMTAVLVLGLLAWALVPLNDDKTSQVGAGLNGATAQTGGNAPGPETAESGSSETTPGTTKAGAAAAPSQAAGSGTAVGSAPQTAANPCAGLRATDQGVSPTEIVVAVAIIDLAGAVGNSTFGLRSPDEYSAAAQAYAAGINAEGGVACRKLRVKTYNVNALDQNSAHATCLQIIADKPFAVIDFGGYVTPASRTCVVDAKLPYLGALPANEDEAAGAFPFMFSPNVSQDRAARTWVFEAAARGVFVPQNGFRKLGLLLNECYPKATAELEKNLNKVGVRNDQMSVFTLSACGGIAPPNQISQAVAKHRGDDVSHVFFGTLNGQNYVRQADALQWHPEYLISDLDNTATGAVQSQWPDGFDGALAITGRRSGERSAGIVHPLVTHCNEWLEKANLAPSQTAADDSPLELCDEFRLFAAAANAAGANVVRTTLVNGLATVGRFEGATFGIGIYDRSGKVFGTDFVRATRWHVDCKCFKVLDPEMRLGRLGP